MPRAGFHNDNEYRAYPFVFKRSYSSAPELPQAAIVDCGFIMGLDSAYAPTEHTVYLHTVTRILETFEFLFKTDAPGAANFSLKFTYEFTAEEWQTNFEGAAAAITANFCAEEPSWEGFMVIGQLGELLSILPEDGTLTFYAPENITITDTPDYVVEPARVQSLVRAYVRSISVGNYERPRVPSCQEIANGDGNANEEKQIIVNAECLKNNVKLKAGYNCAIQQDTTVNSLNVTAFRRDGGVSDPDAEICQYGSELPLFPAQEPPEGSVFLNGGPACSDLITSINGVTGPNLAVSAAPGIQIVSAGEHSIKIDVTPSIIQQNCG